MSFIAVLGLLVAGLVVVPVLAHLLRRGRAKEQDFPPARLVAAAPPVAHQRSRLEDRALLSVRGLMIAALAVLGATPLVRCSRLTLSRDDGASVALALVIDDSMSMRAKLPNGRTRWEEALKGAQDLLGGAREGDAVAVVLAGAPARLALAATTDLSAARRAIDDLEPSDRATDLGSSIALARSALKQLPHVEKRVAVLSDLAGKLPDGEPKVWAPLESLQGALEDCGIVSASRRGRRVSVQLACSSAAAARGRSVELFAGETANAADAGKKPQGVLGSAKLAARRGPQELSIEMPNAFVGLDVRLTGSDAIASDDSTPVAADSDALGIAVISDPGDAVATGGPPVVEQALESLEGEIAVRPLPLLPDDGAELKGYAAVVIDDPAGLSASARAALSSWLDRGGVVLGLLGPNAERAQLGSTLEPFAVGAVSWEKVEAEGVDVSSALWLGDEGKSLGKLAARGRARLGGARPSGAKATLSWQDGEPFLLEHKQGRGLVLTAGLPASVSVSDFALRSGFLALLDHVSQEASRRSGPRKSSAGTVWLFPEQGKLSIDGPRGRETLDENAREGDEPAQRRFVPVEHGRYTLVLEGDASERVVTIHPAEILDRSEALDPSQIDRGAGQVKSQIDASREIALILMGLLLLEIALRAGGLLSRRARRLPTTEASS